MDFIKESNSKNWSHREGKVQNTGWQSTYQSDVLNFLLFLFFKTKSLGDATRESDLFGLKSLPSHNFSVVVHIRIKVCI